MKTDTARALQQALLLATLALACPAHAHHSVAAEFDQDKSISFTGIIDKVMWTNPHIYTHIAVKAAEGATVIYRVEGGPPNSLFRRGWRKDTLKAGDVVNVTGKPAKNPESKNVGQATITTADGRKIFIGDASARE